jgi:hypothetical protein
MKGLCMYRRGQQQEANKKGSLTLAGFDLDAGFNPSVLRQNEKGLSDATTDGGYNPVL